MDENVLIFPTKDLKLRTKVESNNFRNYGDNILYYGVCKYADNAIGDDIYVKKRFSLYYKKRIKRKDHK